MALTLKDLAQRALDVQNASNLLGVLRSAHEDLCALRICVPLGSDELHAHPIARLWADKIASLAGVQGNALTFAAYCDVVDLAAGKDPGAYQAYREARGLPRTDGTAT